MRASRADPLQIWRWVLRVCGLVGVGHMALTRQYDPALLLVYGGMMGLPEFLTRDKDRGEQTSSSVQE